MKIKTMTQQEKVAYLTTAPVPQLVGRMAVPTIISMLVTSFYNLADTAFVGQIDTQSTAAVGVVFSVMSLIQAMGFLFGHGSGNYISRKMGAQEFEDAERMAATGFFSAFFMGVLIMLLGLIFLEPLSVLLGSTQTILPYTMAYLRIILIGTPFMMSALVINNQLRFQGSASSAMIGIVSGAVFNMILDPILIFVFQMGVAGAALATTISQTVSFLILFHASRSSGNIRIQWKHYTPSLHYLTNIFRGGVPSLCRQGLASVATILMNRAAGEFGGASADAAIAAMGVVSRVSMFANSALIGFGQGFQPVCGTNYGAGLYDRVREAFWFCVKIGFAALLVISAAGFLLAEPIVTLFRWDDAEVIRIGTLALQLQCAVFPLNAWIVMCNMMLQTIGRSLKASIVASARQGLFFVPLILILPPLFGLLGVQMCQTVADVLSLLLALPLGLSVLQEMKRTQRNNS